MTLSLDQSRTFELLATTALNLQHEYERLSRYYDALARVEHLGLAVPPALRRFETTVDWPRLVVDAVEERLDIEGFRYPGKEELDTELRRVWQANNLDEESGGAHTEAMIYNRAYITVGANEDDETTPLVSVESPRSMLALVDPRTRLVTAAARWYGNEEGDDVRNNPGQVVDPNLATLYLPDVTVWLELAEGRWQEVDRDEHELGVVPVVPVVNRYRPSARFGRSEMYAAMSLTDSAIRRLTGLEIAAETHAVPQRGVLGATKGDFVDSDGNPLPAWEAYFGAVWAMSNEKASIFQFSASDLRNFHETVRLYLELLGTTYGLPEHYVRSSGDNPSSADAIRAAESRLIKRAERKQTAFSGSWEATMRLVRRFQTGEWDPDARGLETVWRDASTPTKAAQADYTTKLVQTGILPIEASWEELGYSATKIERLKAMREREASDPTLERVARDLAGGQVAPVAEPVAEPVVVGNGVPNSGA